MSWEQSLVNAQVEVNRAMFEMNRPGAVRTDPWYAEHPDVEYIREHIRAAIADLVAAGAGLPMAQGELFTVPPEDYDTP
jgi:hypothetical protein